MNREIEYLEKMDKTFIIKGHINITGWGRDSTGKIEIATEIALAFHVADSSSIAGTSSGRQ